MEFLRYMEHSPPGVPFYDVVERSPDQGFALTRQPAPQGWQRAENSEWAVYRAPAENPLKQGWKIHASATPENAEKILETVWDYCIPREFSFKFLKSPSVLAARNGKYGERGNTGKFITIYPADDQQLEQILRELGDLLEGERGPYILSDLRWRSGPLYVRYGAFVERTVKGENGETVYCVEDPDGRLVPDVRGPSFRPPEWAPLPACLNEAVTARNAGTLRDFPFRATKAFHFSNGGGVYYATDTRTGEAVVMKEARPLAGIDSQGRDAVARLEQEHWAMRKLEGLPWIPKVIDYRMGHEHYFLVREYVEGRPLAKEINRRNPLMREKRGAGDFATYTEWAMKIIATVEEAVEAMHERGVVFGDLHPANILVRDDDTIAFIDLEATTEASDDASQPMAAPGFVAPPPYRGTAVDRYCLACLKISVFLPMTALLPWGADKGDRLLQAITDHFPVPGDFVERVRGDLGPDAHWAPLAGLTAAPPPLSWPEPGPGAWAELSARIVGGILAEATPERVGRLYPGDIGQFAGLFGGVNFAHGAAGVLWALRQAGADIPEEHRRWFADRAGSLKEAPPGFYDGWCGIAYALDELGLPGEARQALDRLRGMEPEQAPVGGLYSGLPGIGLTLLHFAAKTGDSELLEKAQALAEWLIEHPLPLRGPVLPGLMHGGAGIALFLLRLHETRPDPRLLQHAETALRRDLKVAGVGGPPPPMEAPWRAPVLGSGGAGLALVADLLIGHYPDPELIELRDELRRAVDNHVVTGAGLFTGRAGVLLTLANLTGTVRARHLNDLAWHAVARDGHIAFIGEQSLRLSADLATGAAGVLFALHCALNDDRAGLPFLRPQNR
ncbi:class III lanthionine synthetase LanKC [Nonomuraea sp. CA-141351]|uniref:class III lanthionine synthetase LanKC n=1 Tax=Nonomuraea sp. CA-141351 TaxID=3239996 RepID=UPI003D8CDBA4